MLTCRGSDALLAHFVYIVCLDSVCLCASWQVLTMRAVFSGLVEGMNRSLVFLSMRIVACGGADFNCVPGGHLTLVVNRRLRRR